MQTIESIIEPFRCRTNSALCFQPYHLFEPFLDISLPIAFEDVERAEKFAANSEFGKQNDLKTTKQT